MTRKSGENGRDYEEWLITRLKNDPEEAAAYLNESFINDGDDDYVELLLLAMRRVATAYGMSSLASKAKRTRESLYKTLSKQGDPKLSTLVALLSALDLRLVVEPSTSKKKSAPRKTKRRVRTKRQTSAKPAA